jgi:hypothetical protein
MVSIPIKASFLSLVFGLSLSSGSYADGNYVADKCVRIYCKNDVKSKVRNLKGHGIFFPAAYDSQGKSYMLDSQALFLIIGFCGGESLKNGLFATDASKLETMAPWVQLRGTKHLDTTEEAVAKCTKMEKK